MKKTEIFIPFTKSLREAVGFDKEVSEDEKYFRCLRMSGYFPVKGDVESYAERMCQLLLEKHEDALLYTEKGLWPVIKNAPCARELYEKMIDACEGQVPEAYLILSKKDDECVAVVGYEDRIEAIIMKNGRISRYSDMAEIERERLQ